MIFYEAKQCVVLMNFMEIPIWEKSQFQESCLYTLYNDTITLNIIIFKKT